MNLKSKTKAVSNLLRWFLANEKKKTELKKNIKATLLYEEGALGEQKEKTK